MHTVDTVYLLFIYGVIVRCGVLGMYGAFVVYGEISMYGARRGMIC